MIPSVDQPFNGSGFTHDVSAVKCIPLCFLVNMFGFMNTVYLLKYIANSTQTTDFLKCLADDVCTQSVESHL